MPWCRMHTGVVSRAEGRWPFRWRGAHDLAQAVADLEMIMTATGVDSWIVLGHSFGSDLAVRYALDHPEHVRSVVGIAGHGLYEDRTWS